MPLDRFAVLLLGTLLLAQAALLAAGLRHAPKSLGGDEFGYVKRAREIWDSGALPRATMRELEAERRVRWELATDTRPPGYPLFVALASRGTFEAPALRGRVALVQFAALAIAVIAAFASVARGMTPTRQMLTATILSGNPWVFEYVGSIYPDSITAVLTIGGLLGLWRFTRQRSAPALFGASALLSSTLLFRPEMIVIAGVVIGVAVLLARPLTRSIVTAAVIGLLVPLAIQYSYRVHFTGDLVTSIFAPWRSGSKGAIAWAGTWLGTEHETFFHVVFRVADGQEPLFPRRSWSTPHERRLLDSIQDRIRANSANDEEIDATFRHLADYRRERMPFRAVLVPKASRAVLLWANTNTNSQLLSALTSWPRPARRGLLGSLLLARVAALLIFAAAVYRLARSRLSVYGHWSSLAWLCVSLVLTRTLLIAGVLDLIEHRYVLQSWLPLLMMVTMFLGGRMPRNHHERAPATTAPSRDHPTHPPIGTLRPPNFHEFPFLKMT